MKKTTPDFPPSVLDFPPLTSTQKSILKEIKSLKEKLKTLPPWDPETGTWVSEYYEIQKRIDDLTIRGLRSGMFKSLPAESRHPGFRLVFDSRGEYAKILPGAGDFHPELPTWAENHFLEWIQVQRLREKGRDNLRKTKIPGLETGIRPPTDLTLGIRVMELRGYDFEKEEDSTEKGRTRTRKEDRPWHRVIKKLVEEGLLPREITPQALKGRLKRLYPDWPWEKI